MGSITKTGKLCPRKTVRNPPRVCLGPLQAVTESSREVERVESLVLLPVGFSLVSSLEPLVESLQGPSVEGAASNRKDESADADGYQRRRARVSEDKGTGCSRNESHAPYDFAYEGAHAVSKQ